MTAPGPGTPAGGNPVAATWTPARPLRFGTRNPYCAKCGDERGGLYGHESSECEYRHDMTVAEVAATMPEHRRGLYLDEVLDRYVQERESR